MTSNTAKVTAGMVPSIIDDDLRNSMWGGRAKSMIAGIFDALDYIRSKERKPVTLSDMENYIQLGNLITFLDKKSYPNMPESIRNTVKTYLNSLPFWNSEKADLRDNLNGEEGMENVKQHGFLEQIFVKKLNALAV